MINQHTAHVQANSPAGFNNPVSGSSVRSAFQSVMAELKARPLHPLALQPYAGSAQRSLAQQIHADTLA